MTKYKAEPINASRYMKLSDETGQHQMTWPQADMSEIAWRFIHSPASITEADKMITASVLDAYYHLIHCAQAKRNAVCEALKKAKA